MLKIRSIDDEDLDAAARLLTRGFPQHQTEFWAKGLGRLRDYARSQGEGSFGSLLVAKDQPVGILLRIPSLHPTSGQRIVNLSSWFVEEKFRWFAPKMLMDAVSDDKVTYTDFSPSNEVQEVNARLGFRTAIGKVMLVPLPLAGIVAPSAGKLVPWGKVPPDALPAGLFAAVEAHRILGCMVVAVKNGNSFHPIVFNFFRKKNLPVASVLYAQDSRLVTDNLGAISRFLLMRGCLFLSVLVPSDRDVKTAITLRSSMSQQVKGEWEGQGINELFSERVFFGF